MTRSIFRFTVAVLVLPLVFALFPSGTAQAQENTPWLTEDPWDIDVPQNPGVPVTDDVIYTDDGALFPLPKIFVRPSSQTRMRMGYDPLAQMNVYEAWNRIAPAGHRPPMTVAFVDSGLDTSWSTFANNASVTGANFDGLPWNQDNSFTVPHGSISAAAAAGNASRGTHPQDFGACPPDICDLHMVRSVHPIDDKVRIKFSEQIINHLISQRFRVINLSFGGYTNSSVHRLAAQQAEANNVVLVASAGNDATSQMHYPSGIDTIISVGCVDRNLNRTSYSNFGSTVDVVVGCDVDINGQNWGGTSFGSPRVAGLAAMILREHPDLTAAQVRHVIFSTAHQTPHPSSKYGLVDAAAALDYAAQIAQSVTIHDAVTWTEHYNLATLTATATVYIPITVRHDTTARVQLQPTGMRITPPFTTTLNLQSGSYYYPVTVPVTIDRVDKEASLQVFLSFHNYLEERWHLAFNDVVYHPSKLRPSPTTRLFGPTRVETAIALSRELYPTSSFENVNTVVLARSDLPFDSLAGAALAAQYHAPILLTPPGQSYVHPAVRRELYRLLGREQGGRVVILGGSAAISDGVTQQLQSERFTVERIAGPTRVETAEQITRKVYQNDRVAVVEANDWQSALLAGSTNTPVLLTYGDQLHPVTANRMGDYHIAISINAASAFTGSGVAPSVSISEPTPAETALALHELIPTSANTNRAVFASSTNFPDALAGTAYAIANRTPMFLVNPQQLDPPLEAWLRRTRPRVTVLGGPVAVSVQVTDRIHEIIVN